jgi:bifunctional non-homologous end joining protein LigD
MLDCLFAPARRIIVFQHPNRGAHIFLDHHILVHIGAGYVAHHVQNITAMLRQLRGSLYVKMYRPARNNRWDEDTTTKLRACVNLTGMSGRERDFTPLRGMTDTADPALAILKLPKRPARRAVSQPRALTLQAGFIPPCLPMQAPSPPSGPLWLHEMKHDGVRIIARKDDRGVRLYNRSGHDLSKRYPLIVEAMARLPSCTIDGEAIACDENGVPSFDLLRSRRRDDRVFLYAFDLIELKGEDRRREPLTDRKAELKRLVADLGVGVLANQSIDGSECDGATVFADACARGLEGIVSKRKDSRYVAGRSPYWVTMENPASEAVRRRAKMLEDMVG